MRRIVDLVSEPVRWEQPSAFKMEYELRAGQEVAATLRFRSSFGSFATGESADGCWTFKRVGFWRTRATVRVCGAEEDLGAFRNNAWTGGGVLELPDGRSYPANTSFWMTGYEFTTAGGAPLLRYHSGGLLKLSATMEILAEARSIPELPWMALLGWYLYVMLYTDASTTGAVAASAAT